MAQNITLMGASYSNVPAVNLPKTGGGTATFTDVTDTTAAAGDVASGKYFYTAAGVRTQGTASGGGGSSNVVSGTFKYTDEGWHTINLQYNGNGYPVAAVIFVSSGKDGGTFASAIRRYAISNYLAVKNNCTIAPDYNNTSNDANYLNYVYKNSTTDASNITNGGNTTSIYRTDESTTAGVGHAFRISGQKAIKVRCVDTTHNTSRYGFLVNTDYTYAVVYSS